MTSSSGKGPYRQAIIGPKRRIGRYTFERHSDFTERRYSLRRDRTGAWCLNIGRSGWWIEKGSEPRG